MYDVYTDSTNKPKMRTRDVCCIVVLGATIFALGIVGGIFIGIYAYHGGPDGTDQDINVNCVAPSPMEGNKTGISTTDSPATTPKPTPTTKSPTECEVNTCPKRKAQSVNLKAELFAPLTEDEMKSIREYFIDNGIVDNTLGAALTLKSNYITSMDVFSPRKADVVQYLDRNGRYPGRYARVIVSRGSRDPPDVMTYLLGPLDEGKISLEQLENDGDVVYEARPIDSVEVELYNKLLQPVEVTLEPMLKESFDGAYFNGGGLTWWPYDAPPGPLEKERESKMHVYFSPYDSYGDRLQLDFLPLSCVIHCPGNDETQWYVHSFYYLNQGPYTTAQDLLDAYNNGTIRTMKLPKGYRDTIEKRVYVGRDDTKPLRPLADMPHPRTYEPAGPRYTIQGHHVQWMGWEFDATSKMMRGGALYDIRYKNTRIAYEVALNEIALIYASDSFERSNVVFTDSTYGIGFYNGILKDIDCPGHASLLDTTYYNAYTGKGEKHASICVFESDGEMASWRHKYSSFQGGLRHTYLVVRYSATVVNYDYIVDYEFHLDGKVYVKVKATGYIQSSFWDADNPNRDEMTDSGDARDAFGFRVSDNTHGIIHDHMFGFKVDLDVIDGNNSFEVIHFKSGKTADAFKSQKPSMTDKPSYIEYNQTRYLEYETIKTERGYRIDLENPKFWTIVNENYRNRWGAKRGYQLLPLSSVLQTMVNDHPAMDTLSFSKYTCAATKYKDTEPYLSSIFDGFRFDNAKGDLDKFLDGEDIHNTDIVNWMAVGFLHIPTAEDVPMTVTLETGFVLKPFNFFDATDVYDMPGYFSNVQGDKQAPPGVTPCLEDGENTKT